MTTYRTETIQDALLESRERFLIAIEVLPDEELVKAGVIGQASVADLMAAMTTAEAELVTGLMQIDQGKKPAKLLDTLKRPFSIPPAVDRDLDPIFDDFLRVRRQLETWVEEFSNKALNDSKKYGWLNGKTLGLIIARLSYENENKYVPFVERFAHAYDHS